MILVIATWNVALVGLFGIGLSLYSHVSAIPCPKEYHDMGGEIVIHCELDYGGRWVLK